MIAKNEGCEALVVSSEAAGCELRMQLMVIII
jgi:hypothetical protein